jgi:two-component system, NtrC family, sensor kinase
MKNRRILIVDDQEDLRELISNFIVKTGIEKPTSIVEKMQAKLSSSSMDIPKPTVKNIDYQVSTAENGITAYKMVQSALEKGLPYALIFLDMRMPPGWDGLETMKKIFKVDQKVQIVLCTAYSDYSWREIVDQIGRRNNLLILKKPFDRMEVAQLALALTEKYNSEAHLMQAQKMDTIGNLSAGLAHDFNNIIGSIQATLSSIDFSLQSATELESLKSNITDDMEILTSAAKQGAEMVDILLTLSRTQELPFSLVDLNTLAEDCVKICKRTLSKSVEIELITSDEPAIINAYPVQIEQTLLNLCINASHAMTIMRPEDAKQGGRLRIEIINTYVGDNMVDAIHEGMIGKYRLLIIEDTGVGIPQSSYSDIFDPFYTTKPKGQGSGLGLSMVYNIIKQHHGFIEVTSEVGKGTTFFIFLPKAGVEGRR